MQLAEIAVPTSRAADSDDLLIKKSLSGDQSGFESLVQRYQNRLFCAMHRYVHCHHLAEEIVQEAFVRAYYRLDTFQFRCGFYTWLFRIALNSRKTYFRNNSRLLQLTDYEETMLHQQVDPNCPPPSANLEVLEQDAQLRQAISAMDPKYRRILILRECENLDYGSIAKILRIRKGTVRSRLNRARLQLRDRYGKQNNEN